MEPRARAGKNRGQQQFSDQERSVLALTSAVNTLLTAHGDVGIPRDGPRDVSNLPLESTKRLLDDYITDFITELCFEAARAAQLAGRQKIKIDDIKFACRKNPRYLGKIQEIFAKRDEIDRAKKLLDPNDDKITKSNVKAVEETLGADDDEDLDDAKTVGGRSTGTGAGK
ncbi:Transcription initiation factor TFIID subunit [Lachnellula suecica]|uniref:Transcription initiation factor TFIID subunit 13 n=1 Tax=Lachnellula suecica TaxID=602035 RepID=A0A8T9BV96_9HELO|nr:Transcription initiation factor TFIID subunit [Lachnellula suecica]